MYPPKWDLLWWVPGGHGGHGLMMPQHDCNLRSSETQMGGFFPFLSVFLCNSSLIGLVFTGKPGRMVWKEKGFKSCPASCWIRWVLLMSRKSLVGWFIGWAVSAFRSSLVCPHQALRTRVPQVREWEGQLLLPPVQAGGAEACCAWISQKVLQSFTEAEWHFS